MRTLFEPEPKMTTKALAPWAGSNRMLAPIVGKEIGKQDWCGVVFAGGMSEVPEIQAREILVNDLHRNIINLARVVKSDELRQQIIADTDDKLFHPDALAEAQAYCLKYPRPQLGGDLFGAVAYFVAVWMGRSAKAGTDDEFKGNLSARFTASGGGSNVRYRSAIESLDAWGVVFRRCEFSCLDFREFLKKCHDRKGHAIYSDAPFPEGGEDYLHKFTTKDHRDLADCLSRFKDTLVVIRYYNHPLIRELYPESKWTWRHLKGRDQANNAEKAEVLIVNGPLFGNQPGETRR